MYTIGQISDMFQIPISTLRYYDKEGLFPEIQRTSGIRKFDERQIDALRVIECLKKSGMEIKDIRLFMQWCALGSATYPQRKQLFENQRQAVEAEIERMQRILDMLRFKCWYYEQAIADGSEQRLNEMLPDKLPPEIQALYDHAHEEDAPAPPKKHSA